MDCRMVSSASSALLVGKRYYETALVGDPICFIQVGKGTKEAQQENTPAGCSKSSSSKAAASEGPRRTLWGTLRV